MIFPTRDIKGSEGTIKAWTPLPDARSWPAFRRMMTSGALVEVPDELLCAKLQPKKEKRSRGRPRKRVEP
jgi:hypothetical protein